MNKIILGLMLLFVGMSFAQSELHWETNFESAKEKAKAENKMVLMSFQGSDWCSNCKRLEKVLFESEEFNKMAKEQFVLLKLDFPARKQNKLPKKQAEYNDEMAAKYNKAGSFPKVFLFKSDGVLLGEMSLASPQLDSYLSSLKSLAGK